MATIPKKIDDRLKQSVKKYQVVLSNAKSRDVGEADTVTIIKDMLSDMFGYDKYTEVTSEYAIRGTYCDLAIKLDNKLSTLIEVKAIGLELKDQHVKQAIDYAANQGVDWAILTNGINWQFYHVTFSKPIEKELVLEFNITEINTRTQEHREILMRFSYFAKKECKGLLLVTTIFKNKPYQDFQLEFCCKQKVFLMLLEKNLKRFLLM